MKRHRDIMFVDYPDRKPISIIVTTLAARAYKGEADLSEAMHKCLTDMGGLINPKSPRVPNPVNPEEDFADKWDKPEGRAKKLEENFWAWLEQARSDFEVISGTRDTNFIEAQAMQKFGSRLNTTDLRRKLGFTAPAVITSPKSHTIVEAPAKPWKR
jgi:hypothetical protein